MGARVGANGSENIASDDIEDEREEDDDEAEDEDDDTEDEAEATIVVFDCVEAAVTLESVERIHVEGVPAWDSVEIELEQAHVGFGAAGEMPNA